MFCFIQNDYLHHISTISVNYIQGKPYYVYLGNVASGLDAHSSSYIVSDISPTITMVEIEKCQLLVSTSKVHLLARVFQHQNSVFLKTKYIISAFRCYLLATNGQLNDTRGYHIHVKPINSTCNMISCLGNCAIQTMFV